MPKAKQQSIAIKYRASKSYSPDDVATIAPILEHIAAAKGGISAQDVVTVARPKDSPLHRYFIWDNEVAAELYREEQARMMLRSIEIRVEVKNGGETSEQYVRAFHAIKLSESDPEASFDGDGHVERRYIPLAVVQDTPRYLAQIIEQAEKQLKTWAERYRTYQSLGPFQEKFEPIIREIERLRPAEETVTS